MRVLALVGLLLAIAVWALTTRAGAVGDGPLSAQPALGTADPATVLMGAAGTDIWAYRVLPREAGPPAGIDYGPGDGAQLAFLRYTDATGWQVAETPRDADGAVERGPTPNRNSPRITPGGGGLLVGRGASATSVLVRSPGGHFREAPPIPDGLLAPAGTTVAAAPTATPTPSPTAGGPATSSLVADSSPAPSAPASSPTPASSPAPAETIAADGGAGRVADAAYEDGGKLQALFGVLGRDSEDAVLHYDDGARTWTREPIDVSGPFTILGIDASGTDAWLLGTDGSSLLLFQRDATSWKPRSLTLPIAVKALPASADPLTVTPDGVWVDAMRSGPTDATFLRTASGVTSWCDDPACDHPFGVRFGRTQGYRSIGFAGGGRVISNPLPPGGADEDNRGTYVVRRGDEFVRMPGGGGSFRPSAAFSSPTSGWLEGPVQVGTDPRPDHLQAWPAEVRAPLTAAVSAPGQAPGSLDSAALAVGQDGGVLRYAPGAGWTREFLLSASGAVSKPLLRGVAWPEPGRAHAVGDLGAMWMWRAETGLWEKDPAAPVGYEKNLMGIAFQADDPLRGYAVGKEGALLHYDKTWTQDPLPAGFENANFTSVAFAGKQALVAAETDVLVNDGADWHVDTDVRRLFATLPGAQPRFTAVAGLPDGGAVAAGENFVIERDSLSAPWRFATQPLLGVTPTALAAFREGGSVRALAAVQPQLPYPVPDTLPETSPDAPPPLIPPFPLPADGYLVRETANGWRDEQRTAYAGSTSDRPIKSDPIEALLVDGNGEGWALGGWSGEADAAGRGNGNRSGQGRTDRARVETAAVLRYANGAQPAQPPALVQTGVDFRAPVARFAVAGHADCDSSCDDLRDESLGPDVSLQAATGLVGTLAAESGGPRMLLYTGGRLPEGDTLTQDEATRYADLLGQTYAAPSAADTKDGSAAFGTAFSAAPAPFGSGPALAGVTPLIGTAATPGARTHYAFDSDGAGGTVRVIVIDNSAGSLAASDPYQNPREPQTPWLQATLADAKARGIPAIVIGSRDLNSRFQPSLNVATDADAVAKLLVDGGASAYFFERPEENRYYPIPSGADATIPSFGTGTLGYRSALENTTSGPDALFGDAGVLIAEVDTAKRDATTNRAPVTVRLLPLVSALTLQAVDGTLLRRSRPSLFQGVGRRPAAGDRWGPAVGSGDPQPPGSDPYTNLPPDQCSGAACATRLTPEYEFTSSDPDIGDFVAQDPASTNLRKPLIGTDDKVVTDDHSGLFCPFNPGTTTITIKAGGLAYSTVITVQAGSVQRPCGTRPLDPKRFKAAANQTPQTSPPPPNSLPPAGAVPIILPPPPPRRESVPKTRARPQPHPTATPIATATPVDEGTPTTRQTPHTAVPGAPPPAGAFARPIPPGGAVIRVFEEKREEEAAPEQSQAALAYRYADHAPVSLYLFGLIVIAAFAGATLRLGYKRRERGIATAAVHVPATLPYRRRP